MTQRRFDQFALQRINESSELKKDRTAMNLKGFIERNELRDILCGIVHHELRERPFTPKSMIDHFLKKRSYSLLPAQKEKEINLVRINRKTKLFKKNIETL